MTPEDGEPRHALSPAEAAKAERLAEQLSAIKALARNNEETLRRFQTIELRLIAAETLREVFERLVFGYQELFDLDAVTLSLADPDYEFQRALEAAGVGLKLRQRLVFVTASSELEEIRAMGSTPLLGPYRTEEHAWMFPQEPQARPASIGALPLVRLGTAIGVLHFASLNPKRFRSDDATDFLQRLAAIAALCIANHLAQHRARQSSLIEPVTGLNDRRFFDQRLQEEVERAGRLSQPLTCVLLDVDRFESINLEYGHKAGDRILREIGALIAEHGRVSDVRARYAGERLVLLAGGMDSATGVELGERLRAAVRQHTFLAPDGTQLPVSISVGVSTLYPPAGGAVMVEAGDALVGAAYNAMLLAKERGRNRVVCAGVLRTESAAEPQEAQHGGHGDHGEGPAGE